MSEYFIQSETLTALANKIRSVTGSNSQMTPAQMATALNNVTGDSGGDSGGPYDSFKFIAFPTPDYPDNDSDPWEVMIGGNGEVSLTDEDENGQIMSYNGSRLGILEYMKEIRSYPAFSGAIESAWGDTLPLLALLDNATARPYKISLPQCTGVGDQCYALGSKLIELDLPSCVSICDYAFSDSSLIEKVVLPTNCTIGEQVFNCSNLDGQTLKLYMHGATVGTCSTAAFGTESGYTNLEIYVPSELVNTFKTSWASGVYADNIFALSE